MFMSKKRAVVALAIAVTLCACVVSLWQMHRIRTLWLEAVIASAPEDSESLCVAAEELAMRDPRRARVAFEERLTRLNGEHEDIEWEREGNAGWVLVRELGDVGGVTSISILRETLEHPDSRYRYYAARALERLLGYHFEAEFDYGTRDERAAAIHRFDKWRAGMINQGALP